MSALVLFEFESYKKWIKESGMYRKGGAITLSHMFVKAPFCVTARRGDVGSTSFTE